MNENANVTESAVVHPSIEIADGPKWSARWKVEKYWAGIEDVRAGTVEPYEVLEYSGNLLVNGGGDVMWLGLKGGLSGTTGLANTYFDNANAAIGVGKSTAAAAVSQTNLQATSTGRDRKDMEATYPTHTTGTGSTAAKNITFRAIFSTAMANFAWNEWGIFNSTADTGGRMLNRKVQALGTKSTAASWTLTCTLGLS